MKKLLFDTAILLTWENEGGAVLASSEQEGDNSKLCLDREEPSEDYSHALDSIKKFIEGN